MEEFDEVQARIFAELVAATPMPEDPIARKGVEVKLKKEAHKRAEQAIRKSIRPDRKASKQGPEAQQPDEGQELQAVPAVARLVNAAENRKANSYDEIQWTAAHLLVDWNQINPEAVPSTAAVGLLQWAKRNMDEFFRTVYAKTVPSRTQLERAERFRDTGEDLTEFIETIQAALKHEQEQETDEAD